MTAMRIGRIGTNNGIIAERIETLHHTVNASVPDAQGVPHASPILATAPEVPPLLRIALAMSGAVPATGPDGSQEWYDTAEELRAVLAQANRGPGPGRVDVRAFPAVTATELQDAVNLRPHVLHISALSLADGLVIDPPGATPADLGHVLEWRLLKAMLKHTDHPPTVVVMNSCWSRPVAEDLLGSVDVVVGVPYVRGAAAPFATAFYGALVQGQPLRAAIDQADNALAALAALDLPTVHPDHVARHDVDLATTRLVAR